MHIAIDLLESVRSRRIPLSVITALSLAILAISIDYITWIKLNVSVLYSLPLVLTVGTRSRRLIWGLALFLVCMTFLVYSQQIPPGAFSMAEPYFLDRVLAGAALVTTVGLLHARMLVLDKVDSQARSLKARNAQVELASRELLRKETL